MKILLISTGKTFQPFISSGCEEYEKRLLRYINFEHRILPDIKNGSKLSIPQLKEAEGKQVLSIIEPQDTVILLDEKGKQFTSEQMATWLQEKFNAGGKRMVFVIGGAFGFSDDLYDQATQKLSLSKMTFSHQMIRLFFMEQLYRSFTILRGEPYHNR